MSGSSPAPGETSFDWPRWRGPRGDGISREKKWNPRALAAGPKIVWKTNVGQGYSAVSIVDGRLYTMGNKRKKDTIFCLNADTGKEMWSFTYPSPAGSYPGPRATPLVDGGLVYTFSREGLLYCLDAADGTVAWQRNISQDHGARPPKWRNSSSVQVDGDVLLINACSHGVALDKNTGETLWASPPGVCGYATPVVFESEGRRCAAIFSATDLYALDIQTGAVLWSFEWITSYDVNAADPIILDGQAFVSSGYRRGSALFRVPPAVGKPSKVWENKNLSAHFSSCILIDGFLYGIDGNAGRGSLKCIEFGTGRQQWAHKTGFGSLMSAGGKLIVLNERGDLFIAQATPFRYQELSRAEDVLSGTCWTPPVLCGGRLYCRSDRGDLICIDLTTGP